MSKGYSHTKCVANMILFLKVWWNHATPFLPLSFQISAGKHPSASMCFCPRKAPALVRIHRMLWMYAPVVLWVSKDVGLLWKVPWELWQVTQKCSVVALVFAICSITQWTKYLSNRGNRSWPPASPHKFYFSRIRKNTPWNEAPFQISQYWAPDLPACSHGEIGLLHWLHIWQSSLEPVSSATPFAKCT